MFSTSPLLLAFLFGFSAPQTSAFAREPGRQAGIMSCMERRGFGV